MKLKRVRISQDAQKVIWHDLECLTLKNTQDNKNHMKLLKGNL